MRLFWFNLTRGNPAALRLVYSEFGFTKGSAILVSTVTGDLFDNPFAEINRNRKPSRQARLSQAQMGPLITLYRALLKNGIEKEAALRFLEKLTIDVGVRFLQSNIPAIDTAKFRKLPRDKQEGFLKKITGRFFNAKGDYELDEDEFRFEVQYCYFADYARRLELPEIGRLFCLADRTYFDDHQQDIDFVRTKTLAEGHNHCDFRFKMKQ